MARNEWTAQSDIYRVRGQKILQITFGVWICRDLCTIWWSQKVCRDFFKRQYKIWFTSYCTILCSGRVYMGTYCEFLMFKFSSSVTGKSKIQFESIYVFLSQIRKCCKLLAFCQNIFVLKTHFVCLVNFNVWSRWPKGINDILTEKRNKNNWETHLRKLLVVT